MAESRGESARLGVKRKTEFNELIADPADGGDALCSGAESPFENCGFFLPNQASRRCYSAPAAFKIRHAVLCRPIEQLFGYGTLGDRPERPEVPGADLGVVFPRMAFRAGFRAISFECQNHYRENKPVQ